MIRDRYNLVPKTHIKLTGNVNTGLTPQQQAVSDMMPKLPRVSVPLSDVCISMVGYYGIGEQGT